MLQWEALSACTACTAISTKEWGHKNKMIHSCSEARQDTIANRHLRLSMAAVSLLTDLIPVMAATMPPAMARRVKASSWTSPVGQRDAHVTKQARAMSVPIRALSEHQGNRYTMAARSYPDHS